MGFADTMRILSNIDCGVSSAVTYIKDKQDGKSSVQATGSLFSNLTNGIARNEVAYEMQKYGNSMGNYINMAAGYGSAESNIAGTLGLAAVNNPWMFFNLMPSYTITSYNSFGFGYPMMGAYPMMGMGGFYC
jgi:hypothetical protein